MKNNKSHKNYSLTDQTEVLFRGAGYIVKVERNKVFLYYMKSSQGGGTRKIPINNEIANFIMERKRTLKEIFKEFNLYRYDNSSNDL